MFMLTAYRVLLCEFFWEFSIFRFCRPLVDIYWHPLLISFQTTNCIPWSQRFFLIFLRENLGTNCIKACSPVRSSWTDKEQLHTESPNFGPRVVKYKTMRSLPKYGVLLTPKYGQKMQILEGYAEFKSFCLHCAALLFCRRGNLAS